MTFRTAVSRLVRASLVLTVAVACEATPTGPSVPANETYASSLGVNIAAMTKVSDDLYYQDMVTGTGATASNGKVLRVNYTGWLVDGTQFDSNSGLAPISFTLGAHQVITGWDLGLVGMKVGGKRKLVIGSLYAYGAAGSGEKIPRHATLVFDVELVSAQ